MGLVFAQDMKLDDILEKYFKVNGGDKLEKLQTYKIKGKMHWDAEFQLTTFAKRPDMERAEMDLEGTRIIVVLTGQTGWMINPISGFDPQDMDADMIKNNKKTFGSQKLPFGWNNPLINWKENGNRIELVGREEMDGTPVYNIKMTFKDNEVINFYMDQEKFLILKMKDKSIILGQPEEVEVKYSDYREVDGFMIPYNLEIFHNGSLTITLTFEKIEFNIPVNDTMFIKPVVNRK